MSSLANYIPDNKMGGAILMNWQATAVAKDAISNDYQSLLASDGYSVKIPTMADLSAGTHTVNGTITYTTIDSASQILLLDQSCELTPMIDAVESAEAAFNLMNSVAELVAAAQVKAVDNYILDTVFAGAGHTIASQTVYKTSSELAASGCVDYAARLLTVLDEESAPESDRFIIAPPWFTRGLQKAGILETGTGMIGNGKVGTLDGGNVSVRFSNNLPTNTIYAGHRSCAEFVGRTIASRIIPNMETKIGSALQYTYIYGCKITRAKGLVKGTILQG